MNYPTKNLMITLNDQQFKPATLESSYLVLICFGKTSLGSCYIVTRMLHELQVQYLSLVRCYMLELKETPSLFEQYGIRYLPTILFFQNGLVIDHLQGSFPKSIIDQKICTILNLKS